MEKLTGQEVVSSIAKQLRSRFSDKEFAKIYKDKTVQAFATPCIFIHSVESSHDPDIGNYAWWEEMIDIRCHPGKMQTNVHTWARCLGPMIVNCIERISVCGQQVKAKRATWKVEDNVLHIFVSYSYRVLRITEEIPDMQTLEYGHAIKTKLSINDIKE